MLYSTVDLEILNLFANSCIVLNFSSSPVLMFLRVYLPLPKTSIPSTSQSFSFDVHEMYLIPGIVAFFRKSLTFEYSFKGLPPPPLFFGGCFFVF